MGKILLVLDKLLIGCIKLFLVCHKLVLASLKRSLSRGERFITLFEDFLVRTKLSLSVLKCLLIYEQLCCKDLVCHSFLWQGSIGFGEDSPFASSIFSLRDIRVS
jgi:hypothetical protein